MSEVVNKTDHDSAPSESKVLAAVNTSELENGNKPNQSWWNKSTRTKERKLLLKLDLFILHVKSDWYTPKASFAAQMFSGYLQAAVYTGLDGVHGIPGWRWLFLICGCINVPGAIWGFFAVPDSPYDTKVFYLNEEEKTLARSRVIEVGRKPFDGVNLQTFKSVLSRPFVWVFVINYIFFCLDTYGPGFFAIYLKSLGEYTVQEVNV
ncbi:hypothetical protein G7Z17_g1490 [Cylindrodendrum hubeiense]|uniref:Uncharacterized protein n=1 Tax=Cylindrodendrum hubeiense TaxID=595255 RepID=A0A9P5HER2_9HYPO|nr:hypothetical protein G7Z17_g1490 [Cylindrodendrum hubeiense]